MYWIAESNGNKMVLTEREALTHYENNNISNRMRLQFIGTTKGENTAEAKKKVEQIINENRPENYAELTVEERNRADRNTRARHHAEIKQLLDEAFDKDVEDARANGVTPPRKSLRIHTYSSDGHSRDEILNAMQSSL